MDKTIDEKIEEYFERASAICRNNGLIDRSTSFPKDWVEIAKMIQLEEHHQKFDEYYKKRGW